MHCLHDLSCLIKCVYGTKACNRNKYQENIHHKLHRLNLRGQTFTERMCVLAEERSHYKHLAYWLLPYNVLLLCCYLNVKIHINPVIVKKHYLCVLCFKWMLFFSKTCFYQAENKCEKPGLDIQRSGKQEQIKWILFSGCSQTNAFSVMLMIGGWIV